MTFLHKNAPSINGEDAQTVDVAWFPYMKSTTPEARRFEHVIDDIQNGRWHNDVARLRTILAEKGKDVYDQEKVGLPSFYVSGTASDPKTMLTHSGLIQVDLDNLSQRLEEARSQVVTNPYAVAAFTSPSGRGLKVILRLDPLDDPLDKNEHNTHSPLSQLTSRNATA